MMVDENMVGKGENAGYLHFPSFSTMFSKQPLTRGARAPQA